MSNFFLILKIRLDQMFEISATLKQNILLKKISMILHHVIIVGLYVLMLTSVHALANYLTNRGLVDALPVIGYFGAVALTFIATIIKINETFTGNEDSEFLLSMPFSSATQVFVMFVIMYIQNLLCCILIELPIYMVYRNEVNNETLSLGLWVLGLLITSLPFCGIAVMVGMFIILCLVNQPKKNQIVAGIALFFVAIVIILAVVMADRIYLVATGKVVYEGEAIARGLVEEICRNFKFGRFYQLGIVEGKVAYTILFTLMSVIWYVVLLFMHTLAYQSVVTELRSPIIYKEVSGEEIVKRMKQHKTFTVMLKKEKEQFSRSENYMLQCAIGIILGLVVPLNFMFIGVDGLNDVKQLIPALICLFIGISNTTYCAMSMEGKRHWIIETSPLQEAILTSAKVIFNLLLTIPMSMISGITFGIAFHLDILKILLYITIGIIYAVCNGLWGNLIGVKFADYSFETESMIMHRGAPFMLGYLPGVIIPIIVILVQSSML